MAKPVINYKGYVTENPVDRARVPYPLASMLARPSRTMWRIVTNHGLMRA